MTGFGTATAQTPGGRLAVEARSVNHRFSEILVRLPRDLTALEDRIRSLVQTAVHRGRIEVVVSRDDGARRPRAVRADADLAAAYARALRDVAAAVGVSGELTLTQVAGLPDVLRIEDDRVDVESLWGVLQPAVTGATEALVVMRQGEGRRLAEDLVARLATMEAHQAAIAGRSRQVVHGYGERLRARLAEVLGQVPIDEARLAGELALFAERTDITEELTRLASHLTQFRQTLQEDAPVGRKLEFILQEMGRETNTIGSKANDLEITRAVIAMKGELESLREQIQNVE
jgi:uncharacterized protein (TIGR00255 family)